MSFETDAPIRTLCPQCERWAETEGNDASPTEMYEGQRYHVRCLNELESEGLVEPADRVNRVICKHERSAVMDWENSDSDTVFYRMKCRDCGEYWTDELIGAQLRAEGEQENDDA